MIKNHDSITGVTGNKNSRPRQFVGAPILSSATKDMMEIGGTNILKASSIHHQLSPSYSKRQNENISVLGGCSYDIASSYFFCPSKV